jgi:hypothetical protein
LEKKLNKNEFIAYQTSKRGGLLKISIRDDRTYIAGQAVTVFSGELLNL